jgi:asparaginyl-tRNA synthetase
MATIKYILNDYLLLVNTEIIINGWVRTGRIAGGGDFIFINLIDGSCHSGIQLILHKNIIKGSISAMAYKNIRLTGTSLKIKGLLVKTPETSKELCEIEVREILHFGKCDDNYPLSKNKMSMEYLRENIHLRPRTNIGGVVARIRNALSFATHSFFQEQGFLYVNTPIITKRDAEGAGECFKVTTTNNKNFFQSNNTYLTVSGQLDVENYACALSKVYTFGPTFRAEHSSTIKHLAEFWMIEPEIAFAELKDIMNISEQYIKYCCKYVLDKNLEDLKFLEQRIDKECINRINNILENNFIQISYTDAIELLIKSNNVFENKVEWGIDLNTEHERYLCENIFKQPIIVYDYPQGIKAFYMKLNEDNKTVAAMDCLVPGIGEIIGGSQREDDYTKLKNKMNELKLDISMYQDYLDLRKFGTIPHSGWGCGFERLVMLITGIKNIRDVIPYPRVYGKIY